MSKYTMQLREIYSPTLLFEEPFYTKNDVIGWFEDYELSNYLTSDEIDVINTRGTWTKHRLAEKIVNHYFMREIGFETMELFRLKAQSFMNEIMEEYLPLIYSASIEYDPLVNVDYKETYTRQAINNGTTSSTSSGTSSTRPHVLESPASSTSANEGVSNDSTTTSSTGSGTDNNTLNETYTKNIKGNSGVSATAQKMIEQYRNNIRAIDKEIIDKCAVLFMRIW